MSYHNQDPSAAASSSQPFRWHYAEFDDSNFQIRGRTLFFVVALFSVILLVALLFLYARWVCRFPPLPPPPATPAHSSLTSHAPSKGLDAASISSLPIVLYRGGSDSGSGAGSVECCICLGVFGDGEKVKVLPGCGHCFHSECVDRWLTAQSSCPLCRDSLRVDSPV
ncbi:RING-H2 finger protein ATL66 [Striga hermonthica]|uniref:RING-type E3 ubiquitin transferase n=1 Tax=Striga hermonthica TaxID=68872 RepID=A0A9N7NH20_STRHE|nr:RING-H2 finger protein ATL66 [Striga hermonthica]